MSDAPDLHWIVLMVASSSALAWGAVAYKLPALRRQRRQWRTPPIQAYWLTLVALALSQTLLIPPFYRGIDWLVGVPNLAALLSDGVTLAGGWALAVYLYQVNAPDGAARRIVQRVGWLVAAAFILMTGLFVLAPAAGEEPLPVALLPRYGEAPFIPLYRLVFLAATSLITSTCLYLLHRYSGLIRCGQRPQGVPAPLRALTISGWLSLVYVLCESARVVTRQTRVTWPIANATFLTATALLAGTVILLIGTTLPSWGPHIGLPRLQEWMTCYWAFRQLFPLWLAVYRAYPGIVLLGDEDAPPPTSALADALTIDKLPFRLCSRVIEIRHGFVRLRPYHVPWVGHYVRERCRIEGVADAEIPLIVEAAQLAAALWSYESGRSTAQPPTVATPPGGADVPGELAVLVQIAHYYRHAPIIRAVLARLDDERRAGDLGPCRLAR